MPIRVLHLVGSPVSEFFADLSRLYAADCLTVTADPDRYEVHIAYVTPDGRWRFPAGLDAAALEATDPMTVSQAVAHLMRLAPEVMVPQMFCLPGMTHYRALFDLLGIGYIGNPPDVMAQAAHKARARAVVAAAGVDVPSGEVLRRGDGPSIEPPAVVKPVDADNSVGVSLVGSGAEYADAVETALRHSAAVIVESYVELGREVRCGIIERGGELIGLPLEEYRLNGSPAIREHHDKLARNFDDDLVLTSKDNGSSWLVDVEDPLTAVVWDIAKRCHRAMGCRHYSLFDFRVDDTGRPWFLEASLYSSFARTSVISTMAIGAGLAIEELFASFVADVVAGG